MGNVVLATAVGAQSAKEGRFFPLTVNYQERYTPRQDIRVAISNASALQPERETLTSRLD